MEYEMCHSPDKNTMFRETFASPPGHRTPVKQKGTKERRNSYKSGMTGFSVLPSHITPPSGLTKFIARNPFEADLTSRLHLSVISPTVFSKASSTLLDSPGFSWSVDELALIQPAKIEEFPFQQMHSSDPEFESKAQAAIDKFFTKEQIIPSPWDNGRQNGKTEMMTPSRPLDELNMTREINKNKKEGWTQTVLSLPPILPQEVEDALKPYFTFNQDQNVETEEANSSNSSLRRKLFFNHDDCTDDDDEEEETPSPSKSHGSIILASSPCQSGMLVHGTPLRGCPLGLPRTEESPCARNLSPPNMSPICTIDMSCQSIRSRIAARLDFTTDMSIDISIRDNKELRPLEDFDHDTNTSLLRSNIINNDQEILSKMYKKRDTDEAEPHNQTTEMISRDPTPLKQDEINESILKNGKSKEILDCLKISANLFKTNPNDTYQQEHNTLLGNSISGQTSDVNSAQDTGYQTYSMSNITGNTDNCSIEPIKKSFLWNEKISSTSDEIRLSDWQDNMKNIFSSTPSKYSRRKDN